MNSTVDKNRSNRYYKDNVATVHVHTHVYENVLYYYY
jgi:hypothetical protein